MNKLKIAVSQFPVSEDIKKNKYRGQHKEHVRELKPESKGIPRKDWDTLPWRAMGAINSVHYATFLFQNREAKG